MNSKLISVAHNGVCLTVVSKTDDTYTVTAIKETLDRSDLGLLVPGSKVNLERSMLMNGRWMAILYKVMSIRQQFALK